MHESTTSFNGVRTILFDAGGVLLDLDYAYLQRLLSPFGVRPAVRQLSEAEALARREVERRVRDGRRVGEVWRDYFHVVLGRVGLKADDHDAVIDTLWDAHQRVGLWTVAIPGAVATVRAVRRSGYRIGVVSNAEGRVARDLDSAGFEGLFETVVDSHVVGVEKPNPKIFAIALERLEADAATTLYIGDVPSVDVAGARAAGINPVLLDRHNLYADVEAVRLSRVEALLDLLR